jgi:uncharacterized membrane protein/predicted hotdog family 3-hydroxylacyl-ACP dehydratase
VRLIAPAVLTIAYPLLISWGLSRFEPRVVALVVLGLLGLRLIGARAGAAGVERSSWKGLWPLAIVAVVVAATAIWNQALGLLMTPVLVNAALLASFALSLRGQPLVETFARLQVDRLAPAEVRYCRRVTWAWCGFFVANGGISLALALAQDRVAWALYTGGLSYLLMGAFFTGEFVYRHARFRRYVGAFTDPLLARWFPPGHAPEIVAIDGNRDDRARSITLEVPTGLAYWPGHFPGEPMLPGVIQVDWALRQIEAWRGARPRLVALEGLKFKRPVRPGDTLVLELVGSEGFATPAQRGPRSARDSSSTRAACEFVFRRGDEEISRGRVVCDEQEPATPLRASAPIASRSGALAGTSFWPDPVEVMMHRFPMIWLRRIEAHDEDETRCLVAVADAAPLLDRADDVGAHVVLEWMAQAVAVHAGLARRARGEAPCLGLLLGSKRVSFARSAYTRDEQLRVVVSRIWGGAFGAASFDCRVESIESGERWAEARLSCFVPEAGLGVWSELGDSSNDGSDDGSDDEVSKRGASEGRDARGGESGVKRPLEADRTRARSSGRSVR